KTTGYRNVTSLRGSRMITGTNHITFSVRDLNSSIEFYRDLLGMKLHVVWEAGAYLTAGETWICLSVGEPKPANDYTHVAFSVGEGELSQLHARLKQARVEEWKQNTSEGNSVYLLDPTGHPIGRLCGTWAT